MKSISKVIVPISPENLGGPSVTENADCLEILASKEKTVLVEFISPLEGVAWFDTYELMFCQRQHQEDVIKVIRKATAEERRQFRVPLWIQGEETPECCGLPMFFVGQIDDDTICTERPQAAKVWWHDRVSFYVFTCPQCLEVKAIGQQF